MTVNDIHLMVAASHSCDAPKPYIFKAERAPGPALLPRAMGQDRAQRRFPGRSWGHPAWSSLGLIRIALGSSRDARGAGRCPIRRQEGLDDGCNRIDTGYGNC